jgi:hypothetical protein
MLLIGALAATLVGCSRQPPPQSATGSCTGTNGFACLERTAGPPIKLATFRINSTAPHSLSPGAPKGNQHAYKHGRYSAEAIGRRRALSALIRAGRALSGKTVV